MADHDIDDDVQEPSGENKDIRQLREQAKKARDLEAQNAEQSALIATLQRENAFRAAGIDPADAKAKYLVKAYDGDLDPAAIRAEAEAAGILSPAAQEPAAEEFQAFDRVGAAAAGGQTATTPSAHDELATLKNPSPEQIAAVLAKHGQPVSDLGPVGDFQSMLR